MPHSKPLYVDLYHNIIWPFRRMEWANINLVSCLMFFKFPGEKITSAGRRRRKRKRWSERAGVRNLSRRPQIWLCLTHLLLVLSSLQMTSSFFSRERTEELLLRDTRSLIAIRSSVRLSDYSRNLGAKRLETTGPPCQSLTGGRVRAAAIHRKWEKVRVGGKCALVGGRR